VNAVSKFLIAVLTVANLGCIGLAVTQIPENTEPPIPNPFRGDTPPELEETEAEGVMAAPSLGPNVFYVESEDLWYRYRYKRWYQAFRWNGTWFIQPDPPPLVVAQVSLDPKDDRIPTLPEYEELDEILRKEEEEE